MKVLVTLKSDQAQQRRFETYRTDRVRHGKRWVKKDVIVENWSQHGRVHLFFPAIVKWPQRELGVWIRVEMPVDPLPTDCYRRDALSAHLAAASGEIFNALERQDWTNLYDDIVVWVPSTLKAPASACISDTLSREVEISEVGAKELEKWSLRLSEGEQKFNQARRYILDHISEHSAGYSHIASELRSAAYFIDSCGTCDADPWMVYRDSLPGRLRSALEDLMARKLATSHGYKTAYHYVTDRAYNASFPLFWRSWPPF